MVAKSHETVIDLWKKRTLFFIKKGSDRNESLFQLFEKVILFSLVTKTNKASLVDVDLIIADAAEFLVSEDLRSVALQFIELYGNSKQSNLAFIKDRLFNSDSTRSLAKQFGRP